jgi:hypothetical protein
VTLTTLKPNPTRVPTTLNQQDDLRGHQTIASVLYNASGGFSWADGCAQSAAPDAIRAAGATFMVGARNAEMARFFNGSLAEIIVWPRALNESERAAAEAYLATKWPRAAGDAPLRCGGPPPNCTLPAPLAAADARLSRFAAAARGAGFADARYELAHALTARASVAAWRARCAALVDGSLPPLGNRLSEEAADAGYVRSAGALAAGIAAVLEGYAGSADADQARLYALWAASA